jgi:hypothetical protein
MILEERAKKAVDIAGVIAAMNKSITVKPNTLLSELNAPLSYLEVNSLKDVTQEHINNLIAQTITSKSMGVREGDKYTEGPHDTMMDSYIKTISQLVKNHFVFSKSTVNKIIGVYIETLSNHIQQYNPDTAAEDLFDVRYINIPEFFKTGMFASILDSYPDTTNIKLTSSEVTYLSSYKSEQVTQLDYIRSALPDSDLEAFNQWVGQVGEQQLVSYIGNDQVFSNLYKLSNYDCLNFYAINILYAYIVNERLDLPFPGSLANIKEKTNLICLAFVPSFKFIYREVLSEINRDFVVAHIEGLFSIYNEDKVTLMLYEDVFNKLDISDSKLETIFGRISSVGAGPSKSDFTIEDLKANKDYYVSQWMSVRSIFAYRKQEIALNDYRLYAQQAFVTILQAYKNEVADVILHSDVSNKNIDWHLASINQEATKFINSEMHIDDFNNSVKLEEKAIKLIAGIMFRGTSAYQILMSMFNNMQVNPKLTPQEAAMFAAIEYLVSYFRLQFDVK